MKRKITVIYLTMLLAAGMLAGCGSNDTSASVDTETQTEAPIAADNSFMTDNNGSVTADGVYEADSYGKISYQGTVVGMRGPTI